MTNLPWLPQRPDDFRARVKSLTDNDTPGAAVLALAQSALNDPSASALSRAIGKLREAEADLSPLSSFRLGVMASSTFDLIADWLPASAARYGVDLSLVLAPFDQLAQEALNPQSIVNSSDCDAVLILFDHRWLQLDRPQLAGQDADAMVGQAVDLVASLAEAVQASGASPILPVLATPPESLFGHMDRRVPGTPRAMINAFNARLIEHVKQKGYYLLDVAAMAESVGTRAWFSPMHWNLYKLPFAAEFADVFADGVGRVAGAIRGKSKKCLVLDLDNTVWGGVVGDDGMEALKIGQGSPEGEAHLAVQRLAKDLRDRGVILAVSSKNEDETARRPFRDHPDMLLAEDDIAVFQANWIDKPTNLEAIAKTLNIGVDALVLLDDNPAERAQVRAALPMVGVPELPGDVSQFAEYLSAASLFEAVNFSDEDVLRAKSYAENAKRAEVMAKTRDLGDYLSALEMTISHAPFDAMGRQRIAQLINKSNQFNLTTRRYTEAEVAEMEQDPAVFTRQTRLKDRFGDFGMINVVIFREDRFEGEPAWSADTWLMSCRVLGRRVEEAILMETATHAKAAGVRYLIGEYIPTEKNGMVELHYEKLGFRRLGQGDSGRTDWVLDLSSYEAPELPAEIKSAVLV